MLERSMKFYSATQCSCCHDSKHPTSSVHIHCHVHVLEYCNGVGLSEPHNSETGVEICVYACLQPLNINPAEQIPLKTNFGTCSPQTRC